MKIQITVKKLRKSLSDCGGTGGCGCGGSGSCSHSVLPAKDK